MSTRRVSQLILLLGITLGMTAVWAGGAPFAGVNGSVLGGFVECYVDGVYVATTWQNYSYCTGTSSESCSDYEVPEPYACWGGYVRVAQSGGVMKVGSDGLSVCTGSHAWCTDLYDATCSLN